MVSGNTIRYHCCRGDGNVWPLSVMGRLGMYAENETINLLSDKETRKHLSKKGNEEVRQ
jgi:hypothetical protein